MVSSILIKRFSKVSPSANCFFCRRNLFRWAISIFTSRSFSSRALAPHGSKYWTAYKSDSSGTRQVALLDMSHMRAEDLDFSVLFPVLDVPNHDNNARVNWVFNPGRFRIDINDPIAAGQEIFNNYGPKANDELLLGYGFCLPDNPNDSVLLVLKPPPDELLLELRTIQPGYFTSQGAWSSEKATFRLKQPITIPTRADDVFTNLPDPLLELLTYIIRHERGLPLTPIPQPRTYLTDPPSDGRKYLPFIARMLVQSLAPRLAKLQDSDPANVPRNPKQYYANIYRQGQVKILTTLIAALRTFTRSLLLASSTTVRGERLFTLEYALHSLLLTPALHEDFLAGVAASAGTSNITQLRTMPGWEEDAFVLLLCYAFISGSLTEAGFVMPDYVPQAVLRVIPEALRQGAEDHEAEDAELMAIVRRAAAAVQAREGLAAQTSPRTMRWGGAFMPGFGGRIVGNEGMRIMVPCANGTEEAKLVVYLLLKEEQA